MSDAPGFPGAFHVEQMFDLWYNLFRHLYAWGVPNGENRVRNEGNEMRKVRQ